MTLVDHNGDTISVEPGHGPHALEITVNDDGRGSSIYITPADAVALGSLLLTWGEERQAAGGLF